MQLHDKNRNWISRFSFQSIRTRLALVFVIFTSLMLVIVIDGLLFGLPGKLFTGWEELQKQSVSDSLNLTADFKKNQVIDWVTTNRKLMEITAADKLFASQVEAILTNVHLMKQIYADDSTLWERLSVDPYYESLESYLLDVKEAIGITHQIYLIDVTSGEIFAATDQASVGMDASWEDVFQKLSHGSEEYVGDVHVDQRSQKSVQHFGRLLYDARARPIAIFLMEVDPSEILTRLLVTGAELGDSGEIVLINEDSMILTNLRNRLPDGSIAEPLKYKNTGVPAMHAAHGENGIIEALDYRGMMVLAAFRFISLTPEWGWGLVVKKDVSEVYAPVQRSIFFSVAMGGVSIFLVIFVTIILAATLTRPLMKVSRAAEKYAEGDFSTRPEITTHDEVGSLARTLNTMADRLQNWYGEMEEQVKSRTKEMTESNERLKSEIHQRLRIEDELRETRDYLDNLLNYANAPMIVWDAENHITRFNRAFERISGRQAVDVLGGSIDQLLPAGQQERARTLMQDAGRGERWETVEIPIQHVDGSVRIVLWNSATIFANNGVIPLATIAQGQDITERKRAEEAQARLTGELAEKNIELEQIVYVTSHDLRSPLVNIQGFSKELDISIADLIKVIEIETMPPQVMSKILSILQDDMPQALSYIQTSAQKMDGLISGLLKLSRLGRAVLNVGLLDMNILVSSVISSFEYQIKEHRIQVDVGDLPDCLGDPVQINQVFSNLIDNAIKYLEPRRSGVISITGTVVIEPQHRVHIPAGYPYVVYCVEDNGIGIASGHKAKIFEIFHRLDPQATAGEGLGLTIVRHILDRQQGKIWVESNPGKGSRFFVALPEGKLMV